MDVYSPCPCACGTKIKFCEAGIDAHEKLQKALVRIQREQRQPALDALKVVASLPDLPPTFAGYVEAVRSQAYAQFGDENKALEVADAAIERFPKAPLPHEARSDVLYNAHLYGQSLTGLVDALAVCRQSAGAVRARLLYKAGAIHYLLGRPLAAWACWQRATKVFPDDQRSSQAVAEQISGNAMLPRTVRHGVPLRQPDELALFNEERQQAWDRVLARPADVDLDDLVAGFRQLAEGDRSDSAAWFNLGLGLAWQGRNAEAIEAMDQFVQKTDDDEAAADAWDIAELLRFGLADDEIGLSDAVQHAVRYEIRDAEAGMEGMRGSGHVVVVEMNGRPMMHWLDRPLGEPVESGVLQRSPRRLARMQPVPGGLLVVAQQADDLEEAARGLDVALDAAAERQETFEQPGSADFLDTWPLEFMHETEDADELARRRAEDVRSFYEDLWPQRPLRSLGGLKPLEAKDNAAYARKLEGVVRFRERLWDGRGVTYDFDRLRNRLGLKSGYDQGQFGVRADFAAMNAGQLAAVDLTELSADELITAYRSAAAMDSFSLTLAVVEEMTGRDMGDAFPLTPAFALLLRRCDDADRRRSLLARFVEHDPQHEATLKLAAATGTVKAGAVDAGVMQAEAVDADQAALPELATFVESLLSADAAGQAAPFVRRGKALAETAGDRDLAERFGSYTREPAASRP